MLKWISQAIKLKFYAMIPGKERHLVRLISVRLPHLLDTRRHAISGRTLYLFRVRQWAVFPGNSPLRSR